MYTIKGSFAPALITIDDLDADAEVRLVSNFVGGDIACGIFAWPIGRTAPNLNALDAFVKDRIPHGSRGYADSVNRFATDEDKEAFSTADERLARAERRVFGDEHERLPAISQQ